MPFVSVVMPSYNHEKFLPYAIESVLRQDFTDFELIIIDDASGDNSVKIIQGFQEKDKRIRSIFHEKNKGFVETYNDGIRASQGKYVAIIDSDDVWVENKLSEQIKALGSNESLVVWSEGKIIDREGQPTGEKFTDMHGFLDKKKSGRILVELLKNNYILGSSLITARKNLENIFFRGGLKYLNDWLFFAELAEHYEYLFIDEPLAKYRIHGANTNRDSLGFLKDYLEINRIFIARYKNIISKDVKSVWYAQIAALYIKLGLSLQADFYILKRFLMDPRNIDTKHNLIARLKARYYFLYLVIRRLPIFLEVRAI